MAGVWVVANMAYRTGMAKAGIFRPCLAKTALKAPETAAFEPSPASSSVIRSLMTGWTDSGILACLSAAE